MGNSETRRKAAFLRREQIRAKIPASPHHGNEHPRFVADVMLGRLAKWLRIAGFDVLYSNRFSDDELIALSNNEGRILLSLDSRLLVRKNVKNFIFVESQDLEGQIKQIMNITHTGRLPSPLSRCLSCNEILKDIPHESVRNQVPAYVFRTQTHYKLCPKCRKIFWSGTHRRSALKVLENLLTNARKQGQNTPDKASSQTMGPTEIEVQ
ncbi:MAG: Mut7-C RNAse domain-containing protein [Acidobacteria bacterium]|nr:Mut7-C RNAse domain-containing protein [Acidobacteriota bacterium]